VTSGEGEQPSIGRHARGGLLAVAGEAVPAARVEGHGGGLPG
jgi:hypothetical protein